MPVRAGLPQCRPAPCSAFVFVAHGRLLWDLLSRISCAAIVIPLVAAYPEVILSSAF